MYRPGRLVAITIPLKTDTAAQKVVHARSGYRGNEMTWRGLHAPGWNHRRFTHALSVSDCLGNEMPGQTLSSWLLEAAEPRWRTHSTISICR